MRAVIVFRPESTSPGVERQSQIPISFSRPPSSGISCCPPHRSARARPFAAIKEDSPCRLKRRSPSQRSRAKYRKPMAFLVGKTIRAQEDNPFRGPRRIWEQDRLRSLSMLLNRRRANTTGGLPSFDTGRLQKACDGRRTFGGGSCPRGQLGSRASLCESVWIRARI